MALRVAIANGNWSSPSTWYLGVKPTAADTAASNGFTVTIDENVTVGSITNIAADPVSVIPIMTGYTTPSGIASASQEYSSPTYAAYKPFDGYVGENTNHWLTANGAFVSPQWLQYQFPTAKIIRAYSVQTTFGPPPSEWQFQGWNGTSWVTLDSVTGISSLASPLSRSFTNETAYTIYRLNITGSSNPSQWCAVGELKMFEGVADSQTSAAGGGFVLANNINLTCVNELRSGNSTLLLWSGGSGITNTVTSAKLVGAGSGRAIDINGTGTLNINIATITGIGAVAPTLIHVGNTATVNIIGTFQSVADIRGTMLNIAAAATVNVTGNFIRDVYTNNTFYTIAVVAPNSILNITGDIITGIVENYWGYEWNLAAVYTINITGSLKTIAVPFANMANIVPTTTGYLKVIGPIITYGNNVVYRNTNTSAINLFTGPFVCSPYGFFPYQVVRMHLIPTTTSYIEFRDETTNGAPSPGAIAPATRLVSPATLVDNLAVNNVRFGVLYALGTLTGTLRMPTATQVTSGIQVDNTFGSAVLTVDGIWNYLVTNINTPDSIGMRLKNVSTPQTTGEQLEAFLRLD